MARTEMNAGEAGFARRGDIPLIALLSGLARWMEERHLELMAEEGFDDLRRAHNAVAANLPAEGMRLTDLAERAGLTKQAVGELVDDAEAKGYVRREPDPTDGRAKLIVWDERGLQSHEATVRIFQRIDDEMTAILGERAMKQLRTSLQRLFAATLTGPPKD